MAKYRTIEVRPGVFHVEVLRQGFIFKNWQSYGSYRIPGIPEYSPWDPAEFTAESAAAFIEAEKAKEAPPVPAGYPKEPVDV